jgi:hypothetical protein
MGIIAVALPPLGRLKSMKAKKSRYGEWCTWLKVEKTSLAGWRSVDSKANQKREGKKKTFFVQERARKIYMYVLESRSKKIQRRTHVYSYILKSIICKPEFIQVCAALFNRNTTIQKDSVLVEPVLLLQRATIVTMRKTMYILTRMMSITMSTTTTTTTTHEVHGCHTFE